MNDAITASHAFDPGALWFWRDGEEAFITMLARCVTMKIEAAGGFGPFRYWVEDLGLEGNRVIRASEI